MKILPLFLIAFSTCICSYGQNFLNGNFEINSAVTAQINLTNSQYNNLMANSIAFGSNNGGGPSGGDIDILFTADSCEYDAQNGTCFIALTGGGTDAISLKLSTPLIVGNSYTISFYDKWGSPPATLVYPFQIGLSTVDSSFGTLLYTAPNSVVCTWSLRTFAFTAPNNGQYITVKISAGTGTDTWCFVDNFTINQTSSITSLDENKGLQIFPNPTESELTITTEGEILKEIKVINVLGEIIYQTELANQQITIDLSRQPKGIYFVKVTDTNKNITNKKIVTQ